MCECLNSSFSFLLKIINILYLLSSIGLLGYGGYEAMELLYFGIAIFVVSAIGLLSASSKYKLWTKLYLLLTLLSFIIFGVLSILLSYSKDTLTKYLNTKILQWVNEDYKVCVMVLAIICGSYILQAGLAFLYLHSIQKEEDEDEEFNSKLLTHEQIVASNLNVNLSDDDTTKSAFVRPNQIRPVAARQPNAEVENIRDRLRNNYSSI